MRKIKAFTVIEVLVSLSLIAITTFCVILIFSKLSQRSMLNQKDVAVEYVNNKMNQIIHDKELYNKIERYGNYNIYQLYRPINTQSGLSVIELVLMKERDTLYRVQQFVIDND